MIRTLLTVCLATATLTAASVISFSAFGAEESTPWKSVFVMGASFSGKTDYTLKNSAGSTLSTTSDKGEAQALIDGEFTYQSPDFPLGGSLIFEATHYKYNDGSGVSDAQKALLFMPRVAGKIGSAEIWAGMGLGVMFMDIGGATSQTSNGITVTMLETSATTFAWSPRIGVDFDVVDRLVMGVQFSYMQTSGNIPFLVSSGSTTASATEDFTRHWISLAYRIGARF